VQREFGLNIILLVAINLLIKPFFIFGIDRTVQNVVGTEQYGMYFTLLSLTYLLQIINDFGIQNFNSREVSQNRHLIHKYLPNILAIKLGLSLLFLLVVFLVGYLAGYKMYFHWLWWLAINQILVSLNFFFRTNLSGLGFYRIDSLISGLDKLLMIGFCAILLWGAPFSESFQIEYFIYAQTAALVITNMVSGGLVWSKLQLSDNLKIKAKVSLLLLRKSIPFAMVILLMSLYTRMDVLMIENMLPDGKYQAGIYGAGYRLLDASNMIGYLFATLLLPMFSRLLKEKASVDHLLNYSFSLIYAGAVSLAVATFFFQDEIMSLLYVDANSAFGPVLGWLMFSFIGVAGTYIFGSLIIANGDLKRLNWLFVIGIITNLGLNILLIPYMQAEGAAIATMVTQTLVFLGQFYLIHKELKFTFSTTQVLRFLFYFGCSLLLVFLIKEYLLLSWVLVFLLSIFAQLLMAILFKLVNFKFLFEFIPRK
jgi:O-antigen/teichoic acid export membrane protein